METRSQLARIRAVCGARNPMNYRIQRVVKGQTHWGIFQNLFVPGDCGGHKYIMIHAGWFVLDLFWRERGYSRETDEYRPY